MSFHDEDDGRERNEGLRVEPGYNPRAAYGAGLSATPRAQPRTAPPADDGYGQQGYGQQHGYDGYDQQGYAVSAERPRKRTVTSAAILLLGVGAFGGIIYYAYSQGMRAGTESVAPILRADPTPTKVKPEQPGGLDVPHQDKLVYDRLTSGGNPGQPEVERLLPPPETPLERPKAEPPPEQVAQAPAEVAPPEPPPAATAPATTPAAPPPADPRYATGGPIPLTPQAQAPKPVPPPATTTQPPAATAQPVKPLTPPPAQQAAPKPATPAPSQTAALPATPPAPTAQPPAPAGAVRVQVGAVDAESKAAGEWSRLQRKFPGELGGLSMRTTKVEVPGKGTFFRIQAGPVDGSRASQVCASLKAQGVGCIIVR
ncbi:SPOR domain-containing protein [Aerophototrophica crusticola]|uniref:SPOR domain-containing protein n=1 Tax=Aerophototrophica crusticola TaxID=1709002 RepID=A0A858R607_9PROT|nr:SPOR domain-containing protein [Rhodospirillaceae bacterium B3]